jgi:hypothetical protein
MVLAAGEQTRHWPALSSSPRCLVVWEMKRQRRQGGPGVWPRQPREPPTFRSRSRRCTHGATSGRGRARIVLGVTFDTDGRMWRRGLPRQPPADDLTSPFRRGRTRPRVGLTRSGLSPRIRSALRSEERSQDRATFLGAALLLSSRSAQSRAPERTGPAPCHRFTEDRRLSPHASGRPHLT